jgi:hypothetical protein
MTRRGTQATRASFVVRVVRDRRGTIRGVIERVATGAKEAFQGVEAIGPVIARMVEYEDASTPAGPNTGHRGEAPSPRRRRQTRG